MTNRRSEPSSELNKQRPSSEQPSSSAHHVTKAYNIHKEGYKSKLMAAAVRNKQDLFNLLGVDYIISPLKIMESLKVSITSPDEKFALVRNLSPRSAEAFNFSQEDLRKWKQRSLASSMG